MKHLLLTPRGDSVLRPGVTAVRRSAFQKGIRRLSALLPALALLVSPLAAPQPGRAGPGDQAPGIAAGLRLDPAALERITGTPPTPGSREEAADLAVLLWLQRFRTPEMVAATWLMLDRPSAPSAAPWARSSAAARRRSRPGWSPSWPR